MKYLLDTNICIYIIKQRPQSIINKFKTLPANQIAISSITLSEMEFGVAKSQKQKEAQAALDHFILGIDILPYDQQATIFYGKIRFDLQTKGTPIGPLDTLIAAHALSLGARLVTNNVKEFSRVKGLVIENWV